jgi:hypothetical protein
VLPKTNNDFFRTAEVVIAKSPPLDTSVQGYPEKSQHTKSHRPQPDNPPLDRSGQHGEKASLLLTRKQVTTLIKELQG